MRWWVATVDVWQGRGCLDGVTVGLGVVGGGPSPEHSWRATRGVGLEWEVTGRGGLESRVMGRDRGVWGRWQIRWGGWSDTGWWGGGLEGF